MLALAFIHVHVCAESLNCSLSADSEQLLHRSNGNEFVSSLCFANLVLGHALGNNSSISNYLLSTFDNDKWIIGLASLRADRFNFVKHILAFNDMPEDNVISVEPVG